jgi:hypothetical protein
MLNIFVYNVKKLKKKEKIKSMYLDYLELDNFKQIILDNLIMGVNYLPYIKYTGFFLGGYLDLNKDILFHIQLFYLLNYILLIKYS